MLSQRLGAVTLVRLGAFADEQPLTVHPVDSALDQEIPVVEINIVPAQAQGLAAAQSNPEPQ